MVFGFEVGEDFRRQLSFAIEGAAGRETKQSKCQCGNSPEHDQAVNETFQQQRNHLTGMNVTQSVRVVILFGVWPRLSNSVIWVPV